MRPDPEHAGPPFSLRNLLPVAAASFADHHQQGGENDPPHETDGEVLDQVGVEEKAGEGGHETRSHGAFDDAASPPPGPTGGAEGGQEEPYLSPMNISSLDFLVS